MKKHIGKYLFFALSFFISLICNAQEPKNGMIPISLTYDNKLNGMSLEETIKMLGEPSIKLKVNSTSSKRNMPPFFIDYFNSHEELVEVLICRWHEIKKSTEICYENRDGKWHVLGRKVTILNKKP